MDLGFNRGHQPQRWGANLLFGHIFLRKLRENERNWAKGRVPGAPLDQPMWTIVKYVNNTFKKPLRETYKAEPQLQIFSL